MSRRSRPGRASVSTLAGLAALLLGGVALLVAIAVHRSESSRPPQPSPALLGPPGSFTTARADAPRAGAGAGRHRHHARRVARPLAVEIPAIGVRARLVPLGLNADGTLEVPSRFDRAGWWTGGPRPGERGPAVVAGHVDSTTGPAVFFRIGELRRGDAVRILRRDGTSARFVVRRSAHYPKSGFPTARVYGPTRRAALRLITCSGDFNDASGHYLDNTVVYATEARFRG